MTVVFLTNNILEDAVTVTSSPAAASAKPVTRLYDGDASLLYESSSAAQTDIDIDAGKLRTVSGVALIETGIIPYVNTVRADAPVGYWRLGEASGTTAVDASGGGRNGVYVNSPYLGADGLLTVGSVATGVDFFRALNHTVSIANVPALGASHAIEAIVKPRTSGDDKAIAAADFFRYLRITASGAVSFAWRDAGAVAREVFTASGLVVPGTTYHIVGAHDGVNTATIYINGVAVATASFTSDGGLLGTWRIGERPGGIDIFDGTIQEVAIYGPAPGANRITAHFNAMTGAGTSSTPRFFADATAIGTTEVATPNVSAARIAHKTFAAVAARYFRLRLRISSFVHTAGELVIGTARTLPNPARGLVEDHEGNVAADESEARDVWKAQLSDPRDAYTLRWVGMSNADWLLLKAAYDDTDQGAKGCVYIDETGTARWVEFVTGTLKRARTYVDQNEVEVQVRTLL